MTKTDEIALAWSEHRNAIQERIDYEVDCCWQDPDGTSLLWDYLYSTYRNDPIPRDLSRWLRNDPVADYNEIADEVAALIN